MLTLHVQHSVCVWWGRGVKVGGVLWSTQSLAPQAKRALPSWDTATAACALGYWYRAKTEDFDRAFSLSYHFHSHFIGLAARVAGRVVLYMSGN